MCQSERKMSTLIVDEVPVQRAGAPARLHSPLCIAGLSMGGFPRLRLGHAMAIAQAAAGLRRSRTRAN